MPSILRRIALLAACGALTLPLAGCAEEGIFERIMCTMLRCALLTDFDGDGRPNNADSCPWVIDTDVENNRYDPGCPPGFGDHPRAGSVGPPPASPPASAPPAAMPPATSGPDTTPPGVPGPLTVAHDGRGVYVDWPAVADTDKAGYEIERQVEQGPWVELTDAPSPDDQYIDANPRNGYNRYRVSSVDTSGNRSAPSAPVQIYVYVPGAGGRATAAARTPALRITGARLESTDPGAEVAGSVPGARTGVGLSGLVRLRLAARERDGKTRELRAFRRARITARVDAGGEPTGRQLLVKGVVRLDAPRGRGSLCLALDGRVELGAGGRPLPAGTARVVGGTGAAAGLGGTLSLVTLPDGTAVSSGTLRRGRGKRLSAACRAP